MKIQLGDFVTAASGSQGGSTYSRNRYGTYKRNKVIPVNPNTPAQQAQKAILAAFAQQWRTLTQAQRDAWDGAVNNFIGTDVFGNSKRFTGSTLFTRINSNLASVGVGGLNAPPLPNAVPSANVSAVSIVVSPAAYSITFTDPPVGNYIQIWATPPVSPGMSYVENLYKQISAVAGGGTSPYDFEADYLAVYGVPPVGTKVFVKMVVVSGLSGVKGVGSSAYAIVA